MEIFSSPNRPFYHSSKMFPLADIERGVLVKCVEENFRKTGQNITNDIAEYLVEEAGGNVFYVQKLANVTWSIARDGKSEVSKEMIDEAFKKVMAESLDYFYSLCELLTHHQLGALRVAAHLKDGEKIFSKVFLKNHSWQRDSLKQAVDALVDKELVSYENGVYKIEDVFFRKWLVSETSNGKF